MNAVMAVMVLVEARDRGLRDTGVGGGGGGGGNDCSVGGCGGGSGGGTGSGDGCRDSGTVGAAHKGGATVVWVAMRRRR